MHDDWRDVEDIDTLDDNDVLDPDEYRDRMIADQLEN